MSRAPLDGVVLITGASSGLGAEFARQLAAEARVLILVARRRERLEALAADLRARHPSLRVVVELADLASPAEIEALVGRLDQAELAVDVLINNAGLLDEVGPFDGTRWERLDQMLQVNVVGFSHLMLRLVRPMVQRGRGAVLTVSSGFGLVFLPGFGAYSATKHYVTCLSETLRLEVGGAGVVVTQVCPGPVATEFLAAPTNRSGHDLPPWVSITPERCVRDALRGLRAGRALVVPTWWMWALLGLGRLSPRWVLRLVFRPIASYLRSAAATG